MPPKIILTTHLQPAKRLQWQPEGPSHRQATAAHLILGAVAGYKFRLSYAENPTALYYGIKEPEVLAYYDKLYQQLHYIPHRETFLLNYTAVILAQEKFETALKGAQNSLPIQHQLYLAVIVTILSFRPLQHTAANIYGFVQWLPS